MMAPTPVGGGEGDPARAPDVITTAWYCPPAIGCSWGTLWPAVAALRAAGIVVVAAAGAGGPGCGTIEYSPAVYDEAYTIGSTSPEDVIASFTGRGPVVFDQGALVKPDLTAPGIDILSCLPGDDYEIWSGTADAVAHVAGVVALVVTAVPELAGNPDAIETRLDATALHLTSDQCGDGEAVPNNVYGHGRVDALAACSPVTAAPPGAATALRLLPNTPNPFNPRTRLEYVLGRAAAVDLRIYDASGRLVRVLVSDAVQTAGRHGVDWDGRDDDGRDVAAGVYLYRLSSGGSQTSRRMVLLR
jgi:subtilisin family serine protease